VRIAPLFVLFACAGLPTDDVEADPIPDPDKSDASKDPYGEICGNGIDDDGDGRVDEDCGPSLFGGVFAPTVAGDPALAMIEAASNRPLAVLQTYHTTSAAGVDKTGPDLAAIFARGQVPHLNVELAYPKPQYASPTAEPIAHDLAAMGDTIARALKHAPAGRMLLTFGAEMNGNWTSWGCLPPTQYIALYRAAHAAFTAKLDVHGIDHRRVRWVFGPDANGSSECPSGAAYYPGHAFADLLGLSAYRSGTATVDTAVIEPMNRLFDGANIPADSRRDRFVLLQTGSRAVSGRDAWITELWDRLAADPRAAGIIYFDAADWAVSPAASGNDGAGWSGLTQSLANAPVADRALEGTFAPHFWDVAYGDPAFGEIQALRDAGLTTGCGEAPLRFCPNDMLDRRAAATLLTRAFKLADGAADAKVGCAPTCATDPITETQLAAAITALGGKPPAANDLPATRARAAVLIARGAKLAPKPL
jgi:Glycosyl hydrolase family 26